MYKHIGQFFVVGLREMFLAATGLQYDVAPSGYGSTSDRHELVREVFYPYAGLLFPREWVYSMVTVVAPGGLLPPHKDGALPDGLQRYHVILQTNPLSWNFHDGDWQQLEVGGVYTLDQTKLHAAVNWGEAPRYHLVIDTTRIGG